MSEDNALGANDGPGIDERKFDVEQLSDLSTRSTEDSHSSESIDSDGLDRLRVTSNQQDESASAELQPQQRSREDQLPAVGSGSTHLEELFFLQSSIGDDLSRPYLESLPSDHLADQIVIGWLRHLVDQAGFQGTLDIIDQYAAVGWISESVREGLEEYLRAFHNAPAGGSGVTMRDHKISLTYIARLVLLT